METRLERGIDAAEALALAKGVGWQWDEHGASLVAQVAGDGAFTARAPDGAAVGMVTCIVWDELAWIGGMAVDEAARGSGIGRALLRRALAHAEEHGARVVGLDATPAGRPLYESEGFVAHGESAFCARPAGPPRAPALPSGDYAIYPVSSCEVMELLAYDKPRFGASRARWLAALVAEEPHRSFVAVHRKTGAFSGHVLAMEDRIGPLVADAPEAAAWLLYACEKAGVPPYAIVASWNPEAVRLFGGAGYAPQRTCVRMTRGGPPPGDPRAVYAVAGWAVG